MIRKYRCIKDFPNTDIKKNDIIEIDKKSSTEYIIDNTIATTPEIVYEYFEKVRLRGFKYSPYSHSKMETWVSCPKKFEFNYIIKPERKETPSPILEKGTLFHAILEHDIVDKLGEMEIEDEFKALKKKDAEKIISQALKFSEESEIYQWIKSLDGHKVPEQEMFLGKDLEPVETLEESLIRGFIDLLIYDEENDKCYIFDWKTGGKSKEQLVKWPKPKDQLELYAIWALQVFGVSEVETAFVYVEHNHMANYTFKKRDLKRLIQKVKNKINNIEGDTKFEKSLSILCAWCDFKELCLGISADRDPKSITKDEIFAANKMKKPKMSKNSKNDLFMKKLKGK